MKKKIKTFSEFAQIISALAVVISLIYVGIQVRQNTLTTQAAMRQSVADNDIAYLMTFLDNSVIAQASSKLNAGDSLSKLEFDQLKEQQHVNFRVFENAHYQYLSGLLENEVWSRYEVIINLLLTTNEAAITHWKESNFTYTEKFQKEVIKILNDSKLSKAVNEN